MKIWTCYDNLPAQQWYYTDDNRIALENQGMLLNSSMHDTSLTNVLSGFCLDLTNGALTNSNQLQTWKCTDNNNNQVWTV